jgi:hypothetical protein
MNRKRQYVTQVPSGCKKRAGGASGKANLSVLNYLDMTGANSANEVLRGCGLTPAKSYAGAGGQEVETRRVAAGGRAAPARTDIDYSALSLESMQIAAGAVKG